MSFKIKAEDSPGNALRFRTEAAAELYLDDLFSRWTCCPPTMRVVPCDEPASESPLVAEWEAMAS